MIRLYDGDYCDVSRYFRLCLHQLSKNKESLHPIQKQMYFDTIVFLHSLYVGLVYSMLAFGATYYRQIVDDLDLQDISLGEDVHTSFTPAIWLSVGAFFSVLCIFALVALLQNEGNIFLYIVPIACTINIIQLLWRARNQQLMVKTQGIVIRHLLIEGNIPIAFTDMSRVHIAEFIGWFTLEFYDENENSIGRCHADTKTMSLIVKSLRKKNPFCTLYFEGDFTLAADT